MSGHVETLPEDLTGTGIPERTVAVLRLIWHRRGVVVAITAFAVLCGVIFSLLTPPRYESTTRLLPAPPPSLIDGAIKTMRPEAGDLAGLAGIANLGSGNGRFMALLQSRVVADRIVDRFDLMKLYGSHYRFEARNALARHIVVKQDRKTSVITLTFSDRDPRRAAHIAQAYVQELEKFNAEMNTSGAHLERVFLESRVKEVDKQLKMAVSQLSEFSTASGLLDPQEQPKSTVDEALKLEAQIIAARADLSGLEQIYNPDSLRVRTARARLSELTSQSSAIQGKNRRAADVSEPSGKMPSIHSIPKLDATYLNLARRVKLLAAVQLSLAQKLELAKTEEVEQLPVFQVMEPAEVPEQRIWPRRTLMVMMSFWFGLLAGLVVVLAEAKWNAIPNNNPFKELLRDAGRGIVARSTPFRSRVHGPRGLGH